MSSEKPSKLTALHIAAMRDNYKSIQLLLSKENINVDVLDDVFILKIKSNL